MSSRERFDCWAKEQHWADRAFKRTGHDNRYSDVGYGWKVWQAAERETRERCAQIAESFLSPEGDLIAAAIREEPRKKEG